MTGGEAHPPPLMTGGGGDLNNSRNHFIMRSAPRANDDFVPLALPLEKLSYVFMHVSNQNYVLHNKISCDFGLNTFLSKSISLDN